MTTAPTKYPRRRWIVPGVIALLVAILAVAFKTSPWPSVLVLRSIFEQGGAATNEALAAHVPEGVRSETAISYDPADPDALLDIHRSAALDGKPLPVIVWIHGGGFIAGGRHEVANYARILAADGYAVVAVDYSLAPAARYPVPVRQVATALAWLSANADRLQLDPGHFVLAGDSAGAQLAAQLAALAASPGYAAATGLDAGLSRSQLRGVVLFCGPHDGRVMEGSPSWFLRTVMWSYLGSRTPDRRTLEDFSVVPHVTSDFPPAFISVGNDDPLAPQSVSLAQALQRAGVRVDTLFYAPSHVPALGHEYQFDLSLAEARTALERTRAFLRSL